ncbi:MAG: nicotinate-nucleotide adenylyltransferase [Vallitalea sp.]|jgi:nicotinate-nucleotide adenylyltransferase|nr:nicotinate-nucleotide adenylyltransferase [Vallitalea sp.]
MNNKVVGIMGGTFDPIHHGHLIVAEYVCSELNLDKIIFIPSGKPYLKSNKKVSQTKHRLNMTKLAIIDNNKFEISTIEIDRKGNTYTVDTIESLNKEYPLTTFYFIIGADSLFDLQKWKNHNKLFNICNFIVVNRGGTCSYSMLKNKIDELAKFNAKITLVHIPDIQISSSEIRTRVKDNLSIKYLLPEKVEKYILDNTLYTE